MQAQHHRVCSLSEGITFFVVSEQKDGDSRRVSTSLRQVLTKFSEFFVLVSISGFPRKFRARKLQERRSPARLTHSIPVFASCTS